MGRRGPLPKKAEEVQGHRARAELEARAQAAITLSSVPDLAPEADVVRLPRPLPPNRPKQWLKATKVGWERFWTSELAQLVVESDLDALVRLFDLRDERERCRRSAQAGRLTLGSQGQPVLNPLLAYQKVLDAEIRALEDRFGLSPAARLRLGITFAEASSELDRLNRSMNRPDDDDDADPRVAAVREPSRDS